MEKEYERISQTVIQVTKPFLDSLIDELELKGPIVEMPERVTRYELVSYLAKSVIDFEFDLLRMRKRIGEKIEQ